MTNYRKLCFQLNIFSTVNLSCVIAGGESFSSSSIPNEIIPRDLDDGITEVIVQLNPNNPNKNWWERMAKARREVKLTYGSQTC